MPIALILGLLPLVPHIVQGVEALFRHQPKSGPTKKQTAIPLLGDAVNALGVVEQLPGANSAVLNLSSTLIEAFVVYFNESGTFPHSDPSQAAKP